VKVRRYRRIAQTPQIKKHPRVTAVILGAWEPPRIGRRVYGSSTTRVERSHSGRLGVETWWRRRPSAVDGSPE
jgi:hypothetical protein